MNVTTQPAKKSHAGEGFSSITPIALEPRFMFDAAGAATGADAASDAQAQAEAEAAHAQDSTENHSDSSQTDTSPADAPAAGSTEPAGRKEVMVVDMSVSGWQDLVKDLAPGTETILIDGSQSGIAQLVAALDGKTGIDALHILSHGDKGTILLGTDVLNADTLAAYKDALASIGQALSDQGDILLYGCEVGEGGDGQAFIDALATVTGADIAASDDLTGASDRGGDWDLEIATGDIEAAVPLSSRAMNDFSGILATGITFDFSSGSLSGGGTDDGAVTQTIDGTTLVVAGKTVDVSLYSTYGYTYMPFKQVDINTAYGYETEMTISLSENQTFDITSLKIYNLLGDDAQSFTFTSDKGDVKTIDVATASSFQNIDFSDFTGINKLTITSSAGDGKFAIELDDIVISNVQAGSSNAAPVATASGGTTSYTENGTGAVIDGDFTVTDSDNLTFASATIAITGNFESGQDVLAFTSGASFGNISGSYDSSTGVLTLTSAGSTATAAEWQSAIRSVTYANSSDAPSEASRIISITVNDGTDDSNTATKDVSVTAVNDDPTSVSATDSNETGFPINLTFTEYTSAPLDLRSINLVDVDSGSGNLTLVLTASSGRFSLAGGTPSSISGNGTGTITLVGTLSQLETYINQPTNIYYTGAENVNGTGEKITVTLNDGGNSGTGGGTTVTLGDINLNITAVDDAPKASGVPSDVTVYTDTETNLDLSSIAFADVDSTTLTVTLTLSAPMSPGTFSSPASGTGVGSGVTATLVSGTVITLTGSIADINSYLDTASNIKYTTASGALGQDVATITIKADDGTTNADVGTINIDAEDPNDAPVIDGSTTVPLLGANEDSATGARSVSSFLGSSGLNYSDADSGALSGIAITGMTGMGEWQYSTDGTTWKAIGSASGNAAVLLGSSSYVRYVGDGKNGEDGDNSGVPTLFVKGWDQTTGSASTNEKVNTANTVPSGGTSAFSTATGQITTATSDVNDAPVLSAASPTFTGITEDATTNGGQTVASILGTSVADVDTGALEGIALYGLTSGNGTWQYSVDSGANWVDVGTVSVSSALLLKSTDKVRFVPNGENATTASISYHAWDQTGSGSAGSKVSVASTGADTAFSTATDTASITVSAVNDAPTVAGVPATVTVTEDSASGLDLSAITFTDLDNGATLTVTFTAGAGTLAATDGTGVTVGGTSTALTLTGTVAAINTYLDTVGAIKYTSAADATGTGVTTIGVKANDGAGSGDVDFGNMSVDVTGVNDAPTVSGVPATVTVTEDSASGLDLSAITFTDVDSSGNITVTFSAGAGTLAATDGTGVTVGGTGTATLTLTGTVSAINTYLDTSGAIKYTSAANATGTGVTSIGVTANDGAGSGDVSLGSMSVNVTGVNDAPVLTPASPTLTGITEDATTNSGQTVDSFLTGVTDADASPVSGIAISGLSSGNGTWQYSIDSGANWVDVGTVSASSALLLKSTDKVRFVPNGENATTASISYHAWDQTGSGSAGSKVSVASTGADTAFSTATDTASITVSAVNDAPTVAGVPATVTVTEDSASGLDLSAITFTDLDNGATLTVTFSAGAGTLAATGVTGVTVGGTGTATLTLTGTVSAINTYLDTSGAIKYTSAANATGTGVTSIGVTANDGAGSGDVSLGSMSVNVTGVNDAPVLTPASPTLTGITEDATTNSGQTVDSFLTGVTDADASPVSGIAISGLSSGNGTWQYSIDSGANWVDVGTVSASSALLLKSTDKVRFVPNGENATTASISYHAWDQTGSGSAGSKVSVASTGADTAFSTATDTASITVSAVNDAPTVAGVPATVTVTEDSASGLDLSAITFTDLDNGATLTVTFSAGAGTLAATGVTGVTVGGTGTATLTLTGTVSAINTYLDTSGAIKYTSAANATGTGVTSIGVTANDGAGSGDVSLGSMSVNVTGVNDAPVLTPASPTLTGITEDATTNSGQTVDSFLTGVTDADASPVSGIAISGLSSGNGTWQYSIDSGANWVDVGTVSASSALLLKSTDKVRFVPNGENATTASISYHAWDQTGSGSAGSKVSVASTGADTAFSTATDTASITVTAVNDAPTVTSGSTVTLTGTDEVTTSSGTVVSAMLTSAGYGDVDSGAVSGIAITGLTGNGTWQYSTDGTTWKAISSASSGAAVLLGASSQVRYVPDGDNGETATLSFKAWDTTSGTASTNTTVNTADTSTSGGTSAFSSDAASASIVVSGINDAPTITDAATVTLTGTNEDTTSTGKAVSDILTSAGYADADSGASSGIAITGLTGNGTWQYSTDGTNWSNVGAASGTAAVLLSSSSQIRYVPDGDNGETATLSFKAWDATSGTASTNSVINTADTSTSGGTSAFSSGSASASIVVSDLNDAPTVTSGSTVTLTGTDEVTTSSGTVVSAMLTSAGYGDVDSGAVSGIAITGLTGNGTWQYSTDGTTWKAISSASSGAAVLLGASSQVRYVPDGDNGETATLSFKAWDTTSGTASTNTTVNTADTSTSGGTSAFSSDAASASIVVSGINDAPTITDAATVTLTGTNEDTTSTGKAVSDILTSAGYADADSGASSGIAITGLTGNGTWQYSTDGTNWSNVGAASGTAAVLLSSSSQIRYVPDGDNGETATLSFKAWDATSGTASTNSVINTADTSTSGGTSAFSSGSASASIVVSDLNDAPTAPGSLPGVSVENGGPLTHTVSVAGFGDVDGDNLAFTATLADGSPLPSWLRYSVTGTNVTFSGEVPGSFIGDLAVRIVATEDASAHLTASSDFNIRVEQRPIVVTPPVPETAPEEPDTPTQTETGDEEDNGTPVRNANNFSGSNGGEIKQVVTGQKGSLSPIDSQTPVLAGLEVSNLGGRSVTGSLSGTGGILLAGGGIGGGAGSGLGGGTGFTGGFGGGASIGGPGGAGGFGAAGAGFVGTSGGGFDVGGGVGVGAGPNVNNGGGNENLNDSGNVGSAAAPGLPPAEGGPTGSEAGGNPADVPLGASGQNATPDNAGEEGTGDVPASAPADIQGNLMSPDVSPFGDVPVDLANVDFGDQLVGAGGAVDRQASVLARALAYFDGAAA